MFKGLNKLAIIQIYSYELVTFSNDAIIRHIYEHCNRHCFWMQKLVEHTLSFLRKVYIVFALHYKVKTFIYS